jgi:hypothetical protein
MIVCVNITLSREIRIECNLNPDEREANPFLSHPSSKASDSSLKTGEIR